MRRRSAGGVRRGETTPVYVRLDRETRDRIEDILEDYQFRDRSHFVLAATKRYLDEIEEDDTNATADADDAAVRRGRTLPVYVRLDGKTLDRIEHILDEYTEFRDRSHFILAAVKTYLDELEEELEEDSGDEE